MGFLPSQSVGGARTSMFGEWYEENANGDGTTIGWEQDTDGQWGLSIDVIEEHK